MVLSVLAAMYIALGLNNPYIGFLADDGLYLLMADILAPGGAPDLPVYAHVRAHSQLPPLFPLALGLVGGGSQDLAAARILVALAMVAAVVAYYGWLRQANLNRLISAVMVMLFALMPITLIHVVDLWSEGMYIALSLAALMSLERMRRDGFPWLPCFATGVLVGCAIATRTVGIALLPAMFIVCLRAACWRAWSMWLGLAVLLAFVSLIDMGHAGISYGDLLRGRYLEDPVATLFAQLTTSAAAARDALPYILFQWRAPNGLQWLLVGVVAALMLGGLAASACRLQPGAVYAACSCAIVALWPFPELFDRFLFPLLPLMLYFAVRGGRVFGQAALARTDRAVLLIVVIVVAAALPGIVRTLGAAASPPAIAAAATFRTTRYWLDTTRGDRQQQAFDYLRAIHDTLPDLRSRVPPDACIQTTLTNLVLVRAQRVAVLPRAQSRLRAGAFGPCNYFYVAAKPLRGETPFYPFAIVKPYVDVVAVYRRLEREGENSGTPIIGMLLRGK